MHSNSIPGQKKVSFFSVILLLSLPFSLFSATTNADTTELNRHLKALTQTSDFRNQENLNALNEVSEYIFEHFSEYADSVWYQPYQVNGRTYRNVVCAFGMEHAERVVVGAHYDVCEDQMGADDNASGVAGLLELARLLDEKALNHRYELVAYTLEEPPHFRSERMGSYIHAKSLADENAEVLGMVCLEMIGYFDDAKKSQDYPIFLFKPFYGSRGDYIGLIRKTFDGRFVHRFNKAFKKSRCLRTKRFAGPKWIPGLDFSDHLNYWKFGYPALMITDTAFYRNKNYHQTTDTLETLNVSKMAKVVDALLIALLKV